MTTAISYNQMHLASAKSEVTGLGTVATSAVVGLAAASAATTPVGFVAMGVVGFFAGLLGIRLGRTLIQPLAARTMPQPS